MPAATQNHDAQLPESNASLEMRILEALVLLERDGVPTGCEGEDVLLRLSGGVPELLLRAWIGAPQHQFETAIWGLLRRQAVSAPNLKTWPLPDRLTMAAPDGRVVHLKRVPPELRLGGLVQPAMTIGIPQPAPKSIGPLDLPADAHINLLVAVDPPKGISQAALHGSWNPSGIGPFFSISAIGITELERGHDQPSADLVTYAQIAAITHTAKRTLERWVRKGKIPPPDYPGGSGVAHKWRWETVWMPLCKLCGLQLPMKFPSSRFV